jgi:hypothetical protein
MLAQDPLTGYYHEIPDTLSDYGYAEYPEVGQAPIVYDGLGYPVGLPFLAPIAAALAPMAAKAVGGLIPQAGRLIGGLLPQAGGLLRRLLPGGGGAPMPPMPGLPRLPIPSMPGLPRPRPFFRAPAPVGWVTPALPFTGMRPRRMYLRCAVWPGAAGMVPTFATQPVPGMPVPGVPVVPPPGAMRVRRRRRRR